MIPPTTVIFDYQILIFKKECLSEQNRDCMLRLAQKYLNEQESKVPKTHLYMEELKKRVASLRRSADNVKMYLIPWEGKIKRIESQFTQSNYIWCLRNRQLFFNRSKPEQTFFGFPYSFYGNLKQQWLSEFHEALFLCLVEPSLRFSKPVGHFLKN